MSLPLPLPRGARTFLPGLGQLLQKGDMRRTQRWQRIVPHKTAAIYRAVAEVEEYASFLPWCISSNVMDRSVDEETGEGKLQTEITVGFQSLTSKFCSRVQLTPMKRVHAESEANEYIDNLSFTWEFASMGEKACRLDLLLDFTLRNAEHLLIWEVANDKVISEYVRQFSKRCVALEAQEREG